MADQFSYTKMPTTGRFIPPNIIEIKPSHTFNFNTKDFFIELRMLHEDSFHTIPLGLEEEFFKISSL